MGYQGADYVVGEDTAEWEFLLPSWDCFLSCGCGRCGGGHFDIGFSEGLFSRDGSVIVGYVEGRASTKKLGNFTNAFLS